MPYEMVPPGPIQTAKAHISPDHGLCYPFTELSGNELKIILANMKGPNRRADMQANLRLCILYPEDPLSHDTDYIKFKGN